MAHIQHWYRSFYVVADFQNFLYGPPKLLPPRGLNPYQRWLRLVNPWEGGVVLLFLFYPPYLSDPLDNSRHDVRNLLVRLSARSILAVRPYVESQVPSIDYLASLQARLHLGEGPVPLSLIP